MFTLDKVTRLVKKRKRVGRGGSRGGTSGKGGKGQNARSGGGVPIGFEGGQMPLHRRLPKRGFNNFNFEKLVKIINVERLDSLFNDGDVITQELLVSRNIIKVKKGKPFMLKVLANGQLTKKLTVHAHAFSTSAKDAIERSGGIAQVVSHGE